MQRALGVGRTDVGRRRERNEDSHLVDDDLGLYVVSDGMGGHAAGDVASALAVSAIETAIRDEAALLEKVASRDEPASRLSELVERAIVEASQRVHTKATEPGGPAGMGCTLTVLVVAGPFAVMGHVGDSRLYLVRGEGVSQLSADHTVVAELLRAGLIGEDEMEHHPYAHVLSRAIGTQPAIQVDTLVLDVLPGDRFLLCSDGFSNYLERPADLASELHGDPGELTESMVAMANDAGGSDNITVVLVEIESEAPQTDRVTRIEDRYDALGSVFLFEDLSFPFHTHILSACTALRHDAGDVVIAEGEHCDSLFMIAAGRYEVLRGDRVKRTVGEGEYVGVNFLLDPRNARATLRAAEPSRLLRLDAEGFQQVIRERPWMGIALLEQLGRRLSRDLDATIQRGESGRPPVLGEHL